jgi:hypothetical protein
MSGPSQPDSSHNTGRGFAVRSLMFDYCRNAHDEETCTRRGSLADCGFVYSVPRIRAQEHVVAYGYGDWGSCGQLVFEQSDSIAQHLHGFSVERHGSERDLCRRIVQRHLRRRSEVERNSARGVERFPDHLDRARQRNRTGLDVLRDHADRYRRADHRLDPSALLRGYVPGQGQWRGELEATLT